MSMATPANMLITSLFAISLPVYTAYHAYKFDKGRCLIPNRKNGVRTGMVWMIMLSNCGFLCWGVILAVMKYRHGWIWLPEPLGPLPTPLALWPKSDSKYLLGCNIAIVGAFVLYDAVNLEEALYWIFLLRSMKRTRSHQSRTQRITRWLNSGVFWIWLGLSLASAVAHLTVPFAPRGSSEDDVSMRIFIFEGGSAVINVILSCVLSYHLPAFVKQCADHGASPDVLSKLTFFREMNKIRLVLRFFFAGGLLCLGIDAASKRMDVILNRFANDIVFMILVITFWLSNIISLMLYLPISYHKSGMPANGLVTRRRATGADLGPHARRGSMQTGPYHRKTSDDFESHPSQLMSQHSVEHRTLVTLLRERGTILDHERLPEDSLFTEDGEKDGDRTPPGTAPRETRVGAYDHDDGDEEMGFGSMDPSEQSPIPMAARRSSGYSEKIFGSKLPTAITRFAGPFSGVPMEPVKPQEVVVQISKEVEITHDRDGDHHDRQLASYPPNRI